MQQTAIQKLPAGAKVRKGYWSGAGDPSAGLSGPLADVERERERDHALRAVTFKDLDETAKLEALGLFDLIGFAEPTEFAIEAAAVHFLRQVRVLGGMKYDAADLEARCVAVVALRRAGARRPDWSEGQPVPVPGRLRACIICESPLYGDELLYCSGRCVYEFHNAKRSAAWLARRAGSTCKHCGIKFTPKNIADFCSHRCSVLFKVAQQPDRPCEFCGSLFKPKALPVTTRPAPRFCSKRCGNLHRWRAKGQPVRQRRTKLAAGAGPKPVRAASLECRSEVMPARLAWARRAADSEVGASPRGGEPARRFLVTAQVVRRPVTARPEAERGGEGQSERREGPARKQSCHN